MSLEKEMKRNQVLLSLYPSSYYAKYLLKSVKELKNKKVCFVSLNKASEDLKQTLKTRRINTKNMFFVDAVSKGLGNYQEQPDTLYISSPAALQEMSLAITEIINSKQFEVVLFDSLSTLTIYDLGKSAERFTCSLVNKIKAQKENGFFTGLEEDKDTELIKESCLYMDKVIRWNKPKIALSPAFSVLAGVLIAGGLFTLGTNSGITGLVVGNSSLQPLKVNATLLLNLIGIGLGLIGASLVVYKKLVFKEVPKDFLRKIKPQKTNLVKVRSFFKKKIKKWVQ